MIIFLLVTDKGHAAESITTAILYMIAKDSCPISIVENNGFRHLIKKLVPRYSLPSRRTITRLLDARYEVMLAKYKKKMAEVNSITLTSDIWTDVTNQSYLGITTHFLINDNQLASNNIGVIPLTERHNSDYIGKMFLSTLSSFEINPTKISAIVTDSAPNVVKAVVDKFGYSKHIPCFAHLLAHVVPDTIKADIVVVKLIENVRSTY